MFFTGAPFVGHIMTNSTYKKIMTFFRNGSFDIPGQNRAFQSFTNCLTDHSKKIFR